MINMKPYNEEEIMRILKEYAPDYAIRMQEFKQNDISEYEDRITKLKNGVILIHFIEQLQILKQYSPKDYELCRRLGPSKHYPDSEMNLKTRKIIDNSAELRDIKKEITNFLKRGDSNEHE